MSFLYQVSGGYLRTTHDVQNDLRDACNALNKRQNEQEKRFLDIELKLAKAHTEIEYQERLLRALHKDINDKIENLEKNLTHVLEVKKELHDIRSVYIKRIDQMETEIKNVRFYVTQFVKDMERKYPVDLEEL